MNRGWALLRARLSVLAVGGLVMLGTVAGVAGALPTADAAPTTDAGGYVDSTARCAAPSKAVAYGYTATSRVAICKDDASGQYQYRGVRVSDGARLILAARSTDRGYVADGDGSTYTVTSSALVVTSGGQQVRSEPMLDFHGTAGTSAPSTSAPSTSAPSTSAQSTSAQPSAAPQTSTPSTPLPPPLPAEVGGGGR